jgi:aspartate/glutamate racemase
MVSTVAGLVAVFNGLAKEVMPDIEIVHLVDEHLLKDVIATGKFRSTAGKRLGTLASFAEESGAEAVMLTCSTVGAVIGEARKYVNVPFFRVDEAMADEAVKQGVRIGVIATLYTTVGPTSGLVRDRAALRKKDVQVETLLCKGAWEALSRGDTAAHDRIVMDDLKSLMSRSDVVVLAQASMARVADQIPTAERKVPILSSPRLGVQRLKEVMDGLVRRNN